MFFHQFKFGRQIELSVVQGGEVASENFKVGHFDDAIHNPQKTSQPKPNEPRIHAFLFFDFEDILPK
jgi:hypothetical protein